ncbi:hypothetical protein [Flammeovirga sp. EKP202]|uniref:hypothetical protein n=1 Tax=Flammeovirga sp. EKP202 TaxID=2770592 RepID=UPI00165F2857|nr:hypothetical protein [Flammeovirga sp. EKP202]MBD0404120.1 hypothetical protein [Flammeovirga sp. EKP202]
MTQKPLQILIGILLIVGCSQKKSKTEKAMMKKVTTNEYENSKELRFFGSIKLAQYDEYIKEVEIDSSTIELVLYIDEVGNSESDFTLTKRHLNELESRIKTVQKNVYQDFARKGETHKYILHFLEGMTDEDYNILMIDKTISEKEKITSILNKLNCYRAQINFGYNESFFTYDFTIGTGHLTNYVLNVVYNSELELNYIAEES